MRESGAAQEEVERMHLHNGGKILRLKYNTVVPPRRYNRLLKEGVGKHRASDKPAGCDY